jgi:thiamine biosynthesis lipoprotein
MRIKPIKIIKTGPWASFLFLCALLFLAVGAIGGCSEKPEQLVFSGMTMGTSYQVKIITNDDVPTENLGEQIENRLSSLNQTFSTYIETSELMQFNQAKTGQPQAISEDMQVVMSIAQEVYGLTDGAFDPTVAPLVNLWGFGPNESNNVIPQSEQIQQALSVIGLNHLVLNKAAKKAQRKQDIKLDFSAIAKGYAVDAVADLLESSGIQHYLVEVGGELRARGYKPNGDLWRIAIERPSLVQGDVQQVIALQDVAVATSGDYRNYFEKNGKRYSHTIDPRIGYPVDHELASVTVIEETAVKADALATAMMVMGPEDSLMLAEKYNIPVYILVKEADGFKVQYSKAFAQYLSGD